MSAASPPSRRPARPEDRAIRLFFRKQAGPTEPPPPAAPAFDAALDGEGTGAIDPTPLVEAMAYVREHQDAADHFGRTGDERDLYHHLDRLSEGVAKTFRSYCQAGCGSCCYYPIAMFTTTFTEWEVVRRHIETAWTPAQRADLARRYRAEYTSFWRFVIMALQRSTVTLLATAPLLYKARKACPFLVEGSCSVYPARPHQCRTFGLFAVRGLAREPRVYACNVQGANLLAQLEAAGPQVRLPVLNGLAKRIRRLCQGPSLALPIWIGIWVDRWEAGRAVPGEGVTTR